VISLDADQRGRLSLGADVKGARISRLRPGSPAFMAGLAVDDVVVAVDGVAIVDAEAFAQAVKTRRRAGC
jgi:S1-C subfamily serine protease